MNQIRSEIEKRLQEKEDEFENIRRNHQQSMENLQVIFYNLLIIKFYKNR